jgi:hypothetical protein
MAISFQRPHRYLTLLHQQRRRPMRPRHVLKSAVGPQERCRFKMILSQNDGIDQSQRHLRKLATMVAARILQMLRQETPQLQHSCEFVEKQTPP